MFKVAFFELGNFRGIPRLQAYTCKQNRRSGHLTKDAGLIKIPAAALSKYARVIGISNGPLRGVQLRYVVSI